MLKTLAQAQEFVSRELHEAKEQLLHADLEIKELRDRIAEHTKKKKLADKTVAAASATAAPSL